MHEFPWEIGGGLGWTRGIRDRNEVILSDKQGLQSQGALVL